MSVKTFMRIWLALTLIPVLVITIWWLFFVDISQPTPEQRYGPRESTGIIRNEE